MKIDIGPLKSCITRASGQENARLILNAIWKIKHGMLVTFCGGKVELMSKRKSVHLCLDNVHFKHTQSCKRTAEDVDSLSPRERSRVENNVTLNGVNDKLKLNVSKRNGSISFEHQEIAHIRIFYDCFGENRFFWI